MLDYTKRGALTRHNLNDVITPLKTQRDAAIPAKHGDIANLEKTRSSQESKKSKLVREEQELSSKKEVASRAARPAIDVNDFFTVYSTNTGCTAVNRSLRSGEDQHLSKSGITSEIMRVHGDDQFSRRGAKDKKWGIEYAAGQMSLENIRSVDNYLYARGLNDPRPGTFYRGLALSKEGLDKLQRYLQAATPVNPDGLFSCDANKATAISFADKYAVGSMMPTLVKIEGQTQRRMTSGYAAQGERESIFSTNAAFRIKDIRWVNIASRTYTMIELVEVIPTKGLISGQKFPH